MALYIPKKIKIGFQKRSGTVGEGLLGYVIYIDDKGKLRKETSWQGWRDQKIEPVEYDNVPTPGFIINEAIQRGGWDWYSDTVTKVRIYDSRGFEFEITAQNLISVLMHTDCLKRGLDGEFVYAWAGKDLVLLPTNSQEYQEAVRFTTLQRQKVSSKELKPGFAYLDKNQNTCIYLGHFPYYRHDIKPEKKHIFGFEADWCDSKDGYKQKKRWEVGYKAPADIKEQVSAHEVSEYGVLLEQFNNSPCNQAVVGYKLAPTIVQWNTPIYFQGKTQIWKVEQSTSYYYYRNNHRLNKFWTVKVDKTITYAKSTLEDFLLDVGIPKNVNQNRHSNDEYYLKNYPEEAAQFEISKETFSKYNPQKIVAISDKNIELETKQ